MISSQEAWQHCTHQHTKIQSIEPEKTSDVHIHFMEAAEYFMRSRAVRWYANKASQMKNMGERATTTTKGRLGKTPETLLSSFVSQQNRKKWETHYGRALASFYCSCNASCRYICVRIKKKTMERKLKFYSGFMHLPFLLISVYHPLRPIETMKYSIHKHSSLISLTRARRCLSEFETFKELATKRTSINIFLFRARGYSDPNRGAGATSFYIKGCEQHLSDHFEAAPSNRHFLSQWSKKKNLSGSLPIKIGGPFDFFR